MQKLLFILFWQSALIYFLANTIAERCGWLGFCHKAMMLVPYIELGLEMSFLHWL